MTRHLTPPHFVLRPQPGKLSRLALVGVLMTLWTLFLLVASYMPVVPGLLAMAFIVLCFRSTAASAVGITLLVFVFFGWLNSEKAISGDWAWYTFHYRLLEFTPFLDYLGSKVGVIYVKPTEPVYHFIAFLTARLSGGHVGTLSWVVTALIYLQAGMAIALLFTRHTRSHLELAAAIFVALLVGITFTLTTQLVRQEVAASFLILGAALWTRQAHLVALALVALAVFSHNSVVVPLGIMVFAAFMCVRRDRPAYLRLLFAAPLFVAVGFAFVKLSGQEGYYTEGKSDGAISMLVFGLDFAIFFAFLLLSRLLPELSRIRAQMIATWVLYTAFLAGASIEPLPFLRMYFYLESLRAVMLAGIVVAMFRDGRLKWFVLPMVLLAVLYVEARLLTSPFWYKGDLIAHFLRPLPYIFQ